MNGPLVSVCLITYNHKKYIEQAIESVLAQKINFDWEIIVADDFSTDGTRDILKKYQQKYPQLFRLILQEKNVGPAANFFDLISSPKGKYIAYMECDDYWTDPMKLQTQTDFMEANPNFSLCFGKTEVLTESPEGAAHLNIYGEPPVEILDLHALIQKHYIPSSTLFFRTAFLTFPEFFHTALSGDIMLEVLLVEKGPAKYFSQFFSAYRLHASGITQSAHNIGQGQKRLYQLFVELNKYFDYKYNDIFRQKLAAIAKVNLVRGSRKLGGLAKVRNIREWFPKYKANTNVTVKEMVYLSMLIYCRGVLQMFSRLKPES